MRRLGRNTKALALTLAVVAGGVLAPPATAAEVYAGSCALVLRATTQTPSLIEVTTVSSTCVVNGELATVRLSATAVPTVAGITFNCREAFGLGSADVSLWMTSDGTGAVTALEDALLTLNNADGAVSLTTTLHTDVHHMGGAAKGVQFPDVAQSCLAATNPVEWLVGFAFEIQVD